MRPLVLRPSARGDLGRVYRWYEGERSGLGEEFLAEVRTCLDLVRCNPLIFPVLYRQIRRASVQRFPYGIYFRVIDETVVVVACYHLRRHSAGWQSRR